MPLEVRGAAAAAAAAMMRMTSPPEKKAAAKVALLHLIRVSISVFFLGNSLFLVARSAQSLEGLENLFSLEFLWLLETPESFLRQFSCIITTVFAAHCLALFSLPLFRYNVTFDEIETKSRIVYEKRA